MTGCFLLWTALLLAPQGVDARQSVEPAGNSTAFASGSGRTGLLTDRLARRQERIWHEMERTALETDPEGEPVHPLLFDLLRWAQNSGHSIFIEMPPGLNEGSAVAGRSVVDAPDTDGTSTAHVLLFVETIERACVSRPTGVPGEFQPFEKLKGVRRYLETLAHELTHVRLYLSDPAYARLMDSRVEAIAQVLALNRMHPTDPRRATQLREVQLRLDLLREAVERPALGVERGVHVELLASQQARSAGAQR